MKEEDVEVVWSKDESKCGVKIWGEFYGIFDLKRNKKIANYIHDKDTLPISDPALLEGF